MSASQFMVNQQGLKKQKQTNQDLDQKKLWCIETEVVSIDDAIIK